MQEIKSILSDITGKKNIYLTRRGNISIKESLRFCKDKGFTSVQIQDQGGWITYRQFSDKLKLNLHEIKTDHGLFEGSFSSTILLINTMPGYASILDTSKISAKDSIIINDISGSIGHPECRWGNIIIGTFGNEKPVNLGRGGFIATDFDMKLEEETFTEKEHNILKEKLQNLKERITSFNKTNKKIKKDLSDYNIIHPEKEGINVMIKTDDEKEKNQIIDYCKKNNYEYTECPCDIRMLDKGISIEVKRQ